MAFAAPLLAIQHVILAAARTIRLALMEPVLLSIRLRKIPLLGIFAAPVRETAAETARAFVKRAAEIVSEMPAILVPQTTTAQVDFVSVPMGIAL